MNPDRTGTSQENLSTEHREEGDARLPSDTLDRPKDQVHPAREFTPGEDEGKAEPGD